MNNLKTLVLMQLKDKIDFSFIKSKKQTIFKVVLSLLKFVIITALIYAVFYVLNYLRLVSILPGIPQNFMSFVFTIMMLLSIIVCTAGLVKSLYFAKDNQLLLTLPCNRTQVFTSKLIVYYIYEFARNIYFMLPLLLAYGLINSLPFYYFIWILLAMFVITAIPVVLGALLSIPAMFIANFVKQYKWLEYSLLVLFSAGVVVSIILLINAIPANIDLIGNWGTTFWQIQNLLDSFSKIFIPFVWILESVIGQRYGVSNRMFYGMQFAMIAGVLASIILIGFLLFVLVRPLFFKMASTPFEYKKVKVTKKYQDIKHNSIFSSIKKDIILMFRTPDKLFGLLAIVIGMPIAVFLLNKIFAAMDTRLSGAYMAIAFNMLIILLFALSTNTGISHIYSEEGASSYLMRTNPQSHLKLLFSKLIINITLVTLSLLATTFVFVSFTNFNFGDALLIFSVLESVYIAHILWSAELDIMNPQTAQYQSTGTHVNNPNEVKSSIYIFLLSALVAFLTFFFISKGNLVFLRVLVFTVLFLVLRIWLYINKIKVYYKEKQ